MFKQGDIIIVPFPFSDLQGIKQRPVLILSQDKDIYEVENVITCGITSNLKNTKHSVLIENSDLSEGTIPKASRIKVDKLFTLNQQIIKRKVGSLKEEIFNKVRKEFNNLL